MDVALRTGRLVRVKPDYYVAKDTLDLLRAKLVAHLARACADPRRSGRS